jgi:CxxC motif-containing protein (DUF1111 family)
MLQQVKSVFARQWHFVSKTPTTLVGGALLALSSAGVLIGQSVASDPGVRGVSIDAGAPLDSVATIRGASEFFQNGLTRFQNVESVSGTANNGLGPRFNSIQCSSCHAQPAIGGTSPSATDFPKLGPNPQTQSQVYNTAGQNNQNTLPSFIAPDGPVREARFKFFLDGDGPRSGRRDRDGDGGGPTPDGGVHDLFVISGRDDAGTCAIKQPDFARNLALNNVIFRIPTPVFGAGLIENIDDATIRSNMAANARLKEVLGISGHVNTNGNDGTITRFGWKAQNKSLEIFAAEAYNVEMGVTNELFPTERPSPDEALHGGLPGNCRLNPTPEDNTNFFPGTLNPDPAMQMAQVPGDVVQFAMFMRLLKPPKPATSFPGATAASIANGGQDFVNIGCALCHTPSLQTAKSAFPDMNQVNANLFSDLLVHHMGTNLADGVSQGGAGPDEFRSAPLWGLGQRIFFLHDGRTKDLLDAIQEHASQGSEANGVIRNFNNNLTPQQQQDLLNFLRSL